MKPRSYKGIYNRLSKINFLERNYSLKFLFIAFLGIHVPVAGLVMLVVFDSQLLETVAPALLVVLALTVLSTLFTMRFLNRLLHPLKDANKALLDYLENSKLPALPGHYRDEAGMLLKNINTTLSSMDALISEKRNLISLLSHDMRQPLVHLQGLGLLVSKTDNAEEAQQLGEMILDSAKRQLSLHEAILSMMKEESVELNKSTFEEIRVFELMSEAINELKPVTDEKKINIQVEATNPRISICVNRILFKQVFKNLLHNAIKFSNIGSFIETGIRNNGNTGFIFIKDHGIGFNPSDAERIFERFTKAGRKGTNNESSVGVGLFLSRQIVEKHAGKLYARSNGYNTGSTFIIEPPCHQAETVPQVPVDHASVGSGSL